MLPDAVATDPDGLALDDLTRTRSWAELADRATRAGHLFRDTFGVEPGGHVSLLMGNRVEFIELAMGALLSGVWLTPINWHLTAEEAAYIVDDSGSTLVITDDLYAATARAGGRRPGGAGRRGRARRRAGGRRRRAVRRRRHRRRLDALHERHHRTAQGGQAGHRSRPWRPRATSPAPRAWASGSTARAPTWSPVRSTTRPRSASRRSTCRTARPLVIMPRWDEQTALDLIDERQVRNTHLVPTMFVRLLRLPDDVRVVLRRLVAGHRPARRRAGVGPGEDPHDRLVGSGAGGVLGRQRGRCRDDRRLARTGSSTRARSGGPRRATRCSRPTPTAPACRPGEVGPLWCRNTVTDKVFEYHNAPEKTASAYLSPGTYTIGDIGRVDEEGWVYLADRAANMIISGGVNIYPAEIEQVIVEHPAVADVAVFGIPDEEWGESVKAAIELTDGLRADRRARRRHPRLRPRAPGRVQGAEVDRLRGRAPSAPHRQALHPAPPRPVLGRFGPLDLTRHQQQHAAGDDQATGSAPSPRRPPPARRRPPPAGGAARCSPPGARLLGPGHGRTALVRRSSRSPSVSRMAQEGAQSQVERGRIGRAAQLPGRVHGQLGHADVDRRDAEPAGGDRPDRRPARHVVARDEVLDGTSTARHAASNQAAVTASVA